MTKQELIDLWEAAEAPSYEGMSSEHVAGCYLKSERGDLDRTVTILTAHIDAYGARAAAPFNMVGALDILRTLQRPPTAVWRYYPNDPLHGMCYGLALGGAKDVLILERTALGWRLSLPGGELFETARAGFECIDKLLRHGTATQGVEVNGVVNPLQPRPGGS